jgi:hypothetical protein
MSSFKNICEFHLKEMLLPYVFVVVWTSNNIDVIDTRVFQDTDDASRFYVKLKLLCDQQVQDKVMISGELMFFDFRPADRVELKRCDVL